MLNKALKRFSSAVHRKTSKFGSFFLALASVRFPAGTVAGHYKAAVAQRAEQDVVRFDNQKLNWTLSEFDVSDQDV